MTTSANLTQQLLVELSELHMRTHSAPSPKHPEAFGWRAVTGSTAALAARALHALAEADPGKAAELAAWYEGPFGEGPNPVEHTAWTARHVARDKAEVEQWAAEARSAARKAAEYVAQEKAAA